MVRKLIIGGIGFLLSIMGDGASGVGLATTVPHGEVHVVDTSRLNWMSIARNVFDRLIELDADGKMVPGLATAWRWVDDHTLEITLRQGVTFQNGEGFDAAALKRNWDAYTRLGQPHILGEFLSFKPGSRLEIIGPYTVRFHFPELDGTVLVKLSNLHIASPEFHAVQGWGEQQWGILTSAGPWGSGPYKLVDGFSTPGGRVKRLVLEANAHYWDATRLPRLQRIIFDNTLNHKEALEIIRSKDGLVDLISELRPGETFGLAQSPFARVVSKGGALMTVCGQFNMRKAESPWRDARLRQAINLAVNRQELIRDIKGQGGIIPALAPEGAFGFDPALTPYPFDPDKARRLLQEAGYSDGITLVLIAPEALETQAISISMMLERVGFTVDFQILDAEAFQRQTRLSDPDRQAEQQTWDIALQTVLDPLNFPPFMLYHDFALDGQYDWVSEQPELRQLQEQVLRTVDRERQRALIQQMERHIYAQAYFLFLYSPMQLYAVNKAVELVPHATPLLSLCEVGVSDAHWSVRKTSSQQAASGGQPLRADPNNAKQVALGQRVYLSFCAGCHGANLEGQPDWQQHLPMGNFPAPPHDETGHTWHHPDQWLFDIVKLGGGDFAPPSYRSAMPAYKNMLTEEEIWAVLSFIKSQWPLSIRAQQEQENVRDR